MRKFLDKRNQKEFQEKLQQKMEENKLDVLLLTSAHNVCFSTGYLSTYLYNGAIGTEMAVIPAHGRPSLVCSQFAQLTAEQETKGEVDVHGYPIWLFIEDYYDPNETEKDEQFDPMMPIRMAVDIMKSTKDKPMVGIERSTLSHDLYMFLADAFGEDHLVDLTRFMIETHTIKSPWEIDVLRYAAKTAQKMMNITMQSTEPGMTEADLFRIWNNAAYDLTGGHEVLRVTNAHTPGPDFCVTALPRERPLVDGDVVRLDGGLVIAGYQSDLGRVYAVGTHVSDKQQAIFDTLLAARDAGIQMLKPGNRFCDVFHTTMAVCKAGALPHFVRGHVGHSLGMSLGEEYPILSPTNEAVLEPGMVLCFETPYYSSKYGSYNLEDTLVITETGHELFTQTNRTLFVK